MNDRNQLYLAPHKTEDNLRILGLLFPKGKCRFLKSTVGIRIACLVFRLQRSEVTPKPIENEELVKGKKTLTKGFGW